MIRGEPGHRLLSRRGGLGVPIGAWDFDFNNPDGVFDNADFTIVHRSIDTISAYSDQDASGDFTIGIDATADYSLGAGGEHIITLILRDGGIEQAANGLCSYFAFDARYTLLDGILRLPGAPGDYSISIAATSVDLDTGNATDNVVPDPLCVLKNPLLAMNFSMIVGHLDLLGHHLDR